MWLNLLIIMAAANSECNSAECTDNLETAALVQSKLTMKTKDVAQQKETLQRDQAVEQAEAVGNVDEDDEAFELDEEENGEPDLIDDEQIQDEPELVVDSLLETTQNTRPDWERPWLVYFEKDVTDKEYEDFCKQYECNRPKVKPSRAKDGRGLGTLIAKESYMKNLKKEVCGRCIIDQIQQRTALVQKNQASEHIVEVDEEKKWKH